MYAQLKALMAEHGYPVTDGDNWHPNDSWHFKAFARHVLGETSTNLNHLLAYLPAFPKTIASLKRLIENSASAAQIQEPQAPAEAPHAADEAEPVAEPQTGLENHVAAPVEAPQEQFEQAPAEQFEQPPVQQFEQPPVEQAPAEQPVHDDQQFEPAPVEHADDQTGTEHQEG